MTFFVALICIFCESSDGAGELSREPGFLTDGFWIDGGGFETDGESRGSLLWLGVCRPPERRLAGEAADP
jgi:hypothetical protein